MKKERYSRNPQISRALTELGMVRELNEGVKRIYSEMREFFLDDPEYSEPNMSQVKLTLRNNVVMRGKRRIETMLKEADLNDKWKMLNELQKQIIQIIHDRGKATTNELVELLLEERRKIIRTLKKLIEMDIIVWVGSSVKDPTKYYKMK